MARLPRPYAPGVVQHLVQRAAADRTLFVGPDDYEHALAVLDEAARRFGLAVHAYVLLPDEIRLVGTPNDPSTTSRVFQALGRAIAPRVNRRDDRPGAVWERRYRSALLEAGTYLLPAMRFVERRPLVCGLATSALDWRWSSAAHHVGLRQDALISDHAGYWSIRDTPFGRQAAYREWLTETPTDEVDGLLAHAVATGWALGDAAFLEDTAAAARRRLTPRARGRPRRTGNIRPDPN